MKHMMRWLLAAVALMVLAVALYVGFIVWANIGIDISLPRWLVR